MFLPWEYGVRNLARRPIHSGLTLLALTTVILLIFVVVGFIRGLECSLTVSGDPNVILVHSMTSEENIENSAISAQIPDLLSASMSTMVKQFGIAHHSPELYLGTRITTAEHTPGLGLVRGVTQTAPLVRRTIRITEGTWPQSGEVMVGKLAATKLGVPTEVLQIGNQIEMEGKSWKITGRFAAEGSSFESEIWCDLSDLQTATKRQDLSLVAMLLKDRTAASEVGLFCMERKDLELRAIRESEYYQTLQEHYRPVRILSWLIVGLVATAGIFAGLNLMYGALAGRTRELAMLQVLGYKRIAILVSVVQEGLVLASAASLIAGGFAICWVNGLSVRFTMGAFALRIDSLAIFVGCTIGLLLGVLGALPPALKALHASVAINLKAV